VLNLVIVFVVGANYQIRVWDMKTQKNVASFKEHAAGSSICNLDFSENGYYMVSGSTDGTAKIWDLRKLKTFHTLNMKEAG
jgi:WD40 repeat protein